MFPETLETDRLRFERLCRATVSVRDFYEHTSHHNPTVDEETRYLPWEPVETQGEARDRLVELERQWEAGERAEWVVRPKAGEEGAGAFAGTAGLHLRWDQRLAMPGIWLRKPFWGRGYAGERADVLLSVAFDRLDLEVVAVPLDARNEQSRRAVEKYVDRHGGRYEGTFRNDAVRAEGPIDHRRYSISREEYQASK